MHVSKVRRRIRFLNRGNPSIFWPSPQEQIGNWLCSVDNGIRPCARYWQSPLWCQVWRQHSTWTGSNWFHSISSSRDLTTTLSISPNYMRHFSASDNSGDRFLVNGSTYASSKIEPWMLLWRSAEQRSRCRSCAYRQAALFAFDRHLTEVLSCTKWSVVSADLSALSLTLSVQRINCEIQSTSPVVGIIVYLSGSMLEMRSGIG